VRCAWAASRTTLYHSLSLELTTHLLPHRRIRRTLIIIHITRFKITRSQTAMPPHIIRRSWSPISNPGMAALVIIAFCIVFFTASCCFTFLRHGVRLSCCACRRTRAGGAQTAVPQSSSVNQLQTRMRTPRAQGSIQNDAPPTYQETLMSSAPRVSEHIYTP